MCAPHVVEAAVSFAPQAAVLGSVVIGGPLAVGVVRCRKFLSRFKTMKLSQMQSPKKQTLRGEL